jgi:hypothetical protein
MQTTATKERTIDTHPRELLDMKPPPRESTSASCGLLEITRTTDGKERRKPGTTLSENVAKVKLPSCGTGFPALKSGILKDHAFSV